MWAGWIIYRLEDGDWLRERVTSLTNPTRSRYFERATAGVTVTDEQFDALQPYWGKVIWTLYEAKEDQL